MLAGWINFIYQERPGWLLKFDPTVVFKGCMTFYKVLEKAKMRFFTDMEHNSCFCKPLLLSGYSKPRTLPFSLHILPQFRIVLIRNTP